MSEILDELDEVKEYVRIADEPEEDYSSMHISVAYIYLKKIDKIHKTLEAFEIIKNKNVNVDLFRKTYESGVILYNRAVEPKNRLTLDEAKLLKYELESDEERKERIAREEELKAKREAEKLEREEKELKAKAEIERLKKLNLKDVF